MENLKEFKTDKSDIDPGFEGRKDVRVMLANNSEQLRLISLSQTAFEEAAMWGVKAATFK